MAGVLAQSQQLQRQLHIPNGYFLTKRMAELFLLRKAADFPVAIVRPSLVGCVSGLPQPGCVPCSVICLGPEIVLSCWPCITW